MKIRNIILGLSIISTLYAGNLCRGVDVEQSAFGDLTKTERFDIGMVDLTFKPGAWITLQTVNGESFLIIEYETGGAINASLSAGVKCDIATDAQTTLSLNSIEESMPVIESNSMDYFTTWHLKYSLTADHLNLFQDEGVSAIRVQGHNENVTYELTNNQIRKFQKVVSCLLCSDCN